MPHRPKPTEFVKQYAPWSISKINVAAQCPQRFYFQYVAKTPTEVPTSSAMLVGRAVHTLLENLTKGHNFTVSFRLAVEGHNLTTNEIETVRGFVPAIRRFMSRMSSYRTVRSLGNLQVEEQLAIGFDGAPLGYWDKRVFVRGALDLSALFLTKPYAFILDHKTGKWKELKEYAAPFATYCLLYKAHHLSVKKIQTGINHLFTETIDLTKKLTNVEDIGKLLDSYIEYVNSATRAAYNLRVTRKGPLCGWCDYRTCCPAHAEQYGSQI